MDRWVLVMAWSTANRIIHVKRCNVALASGNKDWKGRFCKHSTNNKQSKERDSANEVPRTSVDNLVDEHSLDNLGHQQIGLDIKTSII